MAVLLVAVATACGSDDGASQAGSGSGSGSTASCDEASGDTTVDVALRDFEIDLADDSVAAGTVVLDATNGGPSSHEIVVVKDVAPDDLPYDDEGKVDEDKLPGGAALGEIEQFDAGDTCAGEFDLDAGTYTLFCNVVADGGESHAKLGMVATLTVK